MTTWKPLKQFHSNLVQMLFGQFKQAKIVVICILVWLLREQKALAVAISLRIANRGQ